MFPECTLYASVKRVIYIMYNYSDFWKASFFHRLLLKAPRKLKLIKLNKQPCFSVVRYTQRKCCVKAPPVRKRSAEQPAFCVFFSSEKLSLGLNWTPDRGDVLSIAFCPACWTEVPQEFSRLSGVHRRVRCRFCHLCWLSIICRVRYCTRSRASRFLLHAALSHHLHLHYQHLKHV